MAWKTEGVTPGDLGMLALDGRFFVTSNRGVAALTAFNLLTADASVLITVPTNWRIVIYSVMGYSANATDLLFNPADVDVAYRVPVAALTDFARKGENGPIFFGRRGVGLTLTTTAIVSELQIIFGVAT